MAKSIYFEKIRLLHYPLITYYLWRGHGVFVFDIHFNLKRKFWLRRWIHEGMIKRLYVPEIAKEYGEAIDQTESVFKNHFARNPVIKIISNLYGSDEAATVFKNRLLWDIFRSLYIHSYLAPLGNFLFIPDKYLIYRNWIRRECEIPIPWWSFCFSVFHRTWDKFCYLGGAFVYQFLRMLPLFVGAVFAGTRKRNHYQYAMALCQPLNVKFENKRGFDFLLDSKNITTRNTLFILYMPMAGDWLKTYQARGYQFFKIYETLRFKNLFRIHLSFQQWAFAMLAWLKILRNFFGNDLLLLEALRSLHYYLEYCNLASFVSFENYIYTNLESAKQIAMNILIRKGGGKTWNYSLFIGGPLLYVKDPAELPDRRHLFWAFSNSDHFLGINRSVIDYHKIHRQNVQNYHVIGCIYSEMVRQSFLEVDKNSVAGKYFHSQWNGSQKIVSFFDTTYIDAPNCVTNYEDGIGFYQDILRLHEERKDFLFIIKSSKKASYFIYPKGQWSSPKMGRRILQIWDRLQQSNRVYWAGDAGDMPTIMAISDCVVTHCLSSPTAEALGARKKAVWYEPGFKHRDLVYDKIPGLVLHGYEDLKKRLQSLLYQTSDEEYNDYLNRYIKGNLEYQLDGLALTRFRNLLVQN